MVISRRVVHRLKSGKLHFAGWRSEQGFFQAFRLQFDLALQSSICAEDTILNCSRSDWRGAERPVPGEMIVRMLLNFTARRWLMLAPALAVIGVLFAGGLAL